MWVFLDNHRSPEATDDNDHGAICMWEHTYSYTVKQLSNYHKIRSFEQGNAMFILSIG